MPPYVDKDLGAEGIFMPPVRDESPLVVLLDSKGLDWAVNGEDAAGFDAPNGEKDGFEPVDEFWFPFDSNGFGCPTNGVLDSTGCWPLGSKGFDDAELLLLPPVEEEGPFPKGEFPPEVKDGFPPTVDRDLGAEGIPPVAMAPPASLFDSNGFGWAAKGEAAVGLAEAPNGE